VIRPLGCSNLLSYQAAHDDRTVILTCGVYTISVDLGLSLKANCTCWSHDDSYVWGNWL